MPTVLVVDDSEPTHALLRSAFARAGYRTRHATDATHALRVLAGEPVDAMITDVVMPDMDGLELVRAARSAHQLDASLPTVFYSAYVDADVRRKVDDLQPATVVAKDGNVKNLVSAVADLIAAHGSVRNAAATVILHIGIGLVAISAHRGGRTVYELRRGENVIFEGASIEDVTEYARVNRLL